MPTNPHQPPKGYCEYCHQPMSAEAMEEAIATLEELAIANHAPEPRQWAIAQGVLCLNCIEQRRIWNLPDHL